MKKYFNYATALVLLANFTQAQNDLDVIRYARGGAGGTARFTAMGGAFGALGGDISTAAYNPAGLAIYRKNDLNYGAGLRISNNQGKALGKTTEQPDAHFIFNNFGIVGVWPSRGDSGSRHALSFSNIQQQNFGTTLMYEGYTRNNSIARDMLNQADGKTPRGLNNSYEGLGFDAFVLDYDSVAGKYFSFVDINRSVLQSRQITTSGRVNDMNFSYAYTHMDKLYIGLSLGVPNINFSQTTTHSEYDDRDSMKVMMGANQSYSTTYSTDLPFVYASKLGFNSLVYEEYFKTTGSGINLKIGAIYRINDVLRIGGYYHTPTVFNLTDQYQNSMTTTFDKNKDAPLTVKYPESGGTYSYKLKVPARVSANIGFVIKKIALIGIDYEQVNYSKGQLISSGSNVFAKANANMARKYTSGHNLRIGTELNLQKMRVRAGYSMYGSAFGKAFTQDFVRNTFSLGAGFRGDNGFYCDLTYAMSYYNEEYYPFNTLDMMARFMQRNGSLSATIGLRF